MELTNARRAVLLKLVVLVALTQWRIYRLDADLLARVRVAKLTEGACNSYLWEYY